VLLSFVEHRKWKGPLAWAALEYLALAAHRHRRGWAVPLRVRDIATIGLVTLEQLDPLDGPRRVGYRPRLPEGIVLRVCPDDQDSLPAQASTDRRPDSADKNGCPNNPDSALAPGAPQVDSATRLPGGSQTRRPRPATPPLRGILPTLFDPPAQDVAITLHPSDPRSNVSVHAPTDPRVRHGRP
jgi:hypothetical protein